MARRVAIVDYGMGNLRSVANALELLGALPLIANTAGQLANADAVVLPGVGAFADAMANLRQGGWHDALTDFVLRRQRPFLGICLGMQLIATEGTEHGQSAGLGWLKGSAVPLRPAATVRVPHIGWNEVQVHSRKGILADLESGACLYFVHGFVFVPEDRSVITGTTEYGGEDFAAVVERDNLVATQFHPEKSQRAGLSILGRFLAM